MQKKQYTIEVGGKPLTAEFSSFAEQANAAVLVKYGETVVLGTAVMGHEDKGGDFFPLRVDYEERFYAAGKILGSRFVRREARPSEDAILAGRLVDRTIRPLFDHRMRREVQVVVTVLSYDEEHDPEFPGLIAASLALGVSDIPWGGPVAGVHVARIAGKLSLCPSRKSFDPQSAQFEAFAAGPRGTINMIEFGGNETREEETLEAFALAQKEIDALIDFQEGVVRDIGKQKSAVQLAEADPALRDALNVFLGERLPKAVYPHLFPEESRSSDLEKVERERRLVSLKSELFAYLEEKFGTGDKDGFDVRSAEFLLEEAIDKLVHDRILLKEERPDGRKIDEIRTLSGEVGIFERTHGSALFVRGNTQALAVTTLAAPGAEQLIETMEATSKRRFMLHYNFPAFSTGEIGGFRGPGRREIGHGALALKAILPMIPSQEEFPYTIRVVSEILSSNGSSSMATVCSASLSLMDAGVPLKKPVVGIAMGLMSDDKGNYKVLTDLQGHEDHYGDMDFKVAGTKDGITALQLDVKIGGLTYQMIKDTIFQARAAHEKILACIAGVLPAPRATLSKYAPIILRHMISPHKIGLVIGPGGKTINGLIEKYALLGIDIEEDGRVFVSSNDKKTAVAALEEIQLLTREFHVGDVIEGEIIKILEFGAIVDLGGGQDGMIHVSELKEGFVKNVTDVVKEGDVVRAKVIRVEEGRIGLSMKQLKSE